MSDIDPEARKEVNTALINSRSAAIGLMVGVVHASVKKRRDLKLEREKHEAAKEKAAKEKANDAVRVQYPNL